MKEEQDGQAKWLAKQKAEADPACATSTSSLGCGRRPERQRPLGSSRRPFVALCPCVSPARPGYWTQPSTTPSPSLAEGMFTVTHPLYRQQFEVLNYHHNWGEYRVTFYEIPNHVRTLPAAQTSLVPPDPCAVRAVGRVKAQI